MAYMSQHMHGIPHPWRGGSEARGLIDTWTNDSAQISGAGFPVRKV